MEDTPITKLDPEDHENLDRPPKRDLSPLAYDFKQELAQYAEISPRYEEANKMYICHLCEFRTAFRNSLLNHQAVHSDFRPWVCAMCDYAAKRKQDLKKHLHTIHGIMVESTMLKPVGTSGANATVRTLSREESSEENSWDNMKLNKAGELNPSIPNAIYSHTPSDISLTTLSMTGLPDASAMLIKQEKLDKSATLSTEEVLPSMSNFIQPSPPGSPDYDLPISFPPALTSKHTILYPPQSLPSTDPLPLSDKHASLSGCISSDLGQKMALSEGMSQSLSTSNSVSMQSHKRPHSYTDWSDLSKPQDLSASPTSKLRKTVDSDEHPACSSSITISHARASQTPASFLCEHCDIMFFQRAMYLMHVGLHATDNPWCCAVCGSTFTEKYSFTSHFINQH